MTEHKQVTIELKDGYKINVDEGMEDIISTLNNDGFETYCSCINNQETFWIQFSSSIEFTIMMKFILLYEKSINGNEDVRETLWDFIDNVCHYYVNYDENGDIDENDYWIRNGELSDTMGLRFPVTEIPRFRKLFYEVFPWEEKLSHLLKSE
jgi:hypothetical protein